MNKAVVIVGPTAVGKTALAVKIAKEFKGALVSADSVQVFKSLDIISGKDKDEFLDVEIYLIDVVSPFEPFSVSQFEKLGKGFIKEITLSGKLPIIVGGTGLYVKSLIDGISTSSVAPDLKLRNNLENLSLAELQKMLKKLSAETFNGMNESDIKNKRRLIRKIEILSTRIKNHELRIKNNDGFEFLQIGLELPREELRKRIDLRVDKRIKEGALKEAKDLFKNYEKLTQQVKDANGYKQLFEHFLGKTTIEQAMEKWKISEYRHAKNQMTWFKKDKRILWLDADKKNLFEAVSSKIDTFMQG